KKLFLDKVKKDGSVNFVTAGKLVFLAWSILKLQSDKVLLDAMPPEPTPEDGGWDLDMFRDPADLDYNQVVLAGTATPLTEAIHHEGRRAVTLMELMDCPYGELFVKRLSWEVDLPMEELLAIPVLGPKPIGTPEAVP